MKIPADVSFTIRPARNGFIVETADDAALPHVFANFKAAAHFMLTEFYPDVLPDGFGDVPATTNEGSDE